MSDFRGLDTAGAQAKSDALSCLDARYKKAHAGHLSRITRSGQTSAAKTYDLVLRKTYLLLALSMVPTAFGAWLGIAAGPAILIGLVNAREIFWHLSFALFLAAPFCLIFAIKRFHDRSIGVYLLHGFTFWMGLMLSPLIYYVLRLPNGAALIMLAVVGTAVIFASMVTLATVSELGFAGLRSWLVMGLVALLVVSTARIFLHLPALALAESMLAIVVFSGFLFHDVQRVVDGGETSHVMTTLRVYLDLYNVFSRLLRLFTQIERRNYWRNWP